MAWLWPSLESAIGTFAASFLLWFVAFALLLFLIDAIGERLGMNIRPVLLASTITGLALIILQPDGGLWNAYEAVFYAAALLMILDGRTWALYPLVALATLNRETAVFIPLMYLAVTRDWEHAIGLGGVWSAVYGAIRLTVGPLPMHVTPADALAINLMAVSIGRFLIGLLFAGWLLWLAVRGWKAAPEPLRRAALIVPPYLLLVAVFGVWHEWRLVFSLWPLVVPLAAVGR